MGDVLYLNKKIIKAYNSLKVTEFCSLVDEILSTKTEQQISNIFSKKIYIWNYIRSKDFYKLMALYISDKVRREGVVDNTISLVINTILNTANNDITRRQFCHAMNNKITILTQMTIRYLGTDALDNILSRAEYKGIATDNIMEVFMTHYIKLNAMLDTITDL